MRYQAKAIPLYEGHRQIKGQHPVYTFAVNLDQARLFLSVRYPYPKYIIEDLKEYPEKEATKPDTQFAQDLFENIQKREISDQKTSKCSDSMIELRNWLKLQIEDEEQAYLQYNQAGAKLDHFSNQNDSDKSHEMADRLDDFSKELHLVADQELNHKSIIESIVDYITEKCE